MNRLLQLGKSYKLLLGATSAAAATAAMAVQRAHSQAETAATTANINNTKEANDRAADVDVANTMAAAKAALNGQPLCDAEIVAYMYHPCPFCTKVRMFMDYYKLPYDKVEVDPLRKTQISFSAYKKVPIVLLNGVQINDSAAIVDTLYSLLPQEKQRPATTEEITWRKWADDFLVHLLPSNIYRTPRESLESFDYLMDSSFSLSTSARVLARYSGAAIMYLLVRFKLNAKYGVTDARSQLYDAIDGFINAIGDRKFLSGQLEPGLTDLTVYGMLRSMEGLETHRDLLANTQVRPWYDRMTHEVGESTGRYINPNEKSTTPE